MSSQYHALVRDEKNDPVCACGLRPEILDEAAPVGRAWVAKKVILDHVDACNGHTPSPADPFLVDNAVYPRAGVRRTEEGKWLLTLWDGFGIQHHIDEPEFKDQEDAIEYGQMVIGACRDSGTNLNGWAA